MVWIESGACYANLRIRRRDMTLRRCDIRPTLEKLGRH
jgi:hypothetical protein